MTRPSRSQKPFNKDIILCKDNINKIIVMNYIFYMVGLKMYNRVSNPLIRRSIIDYYTDRHELVHLSIYSPKKIKETLNWMKNVI